MPVMPGRFAFRRRTAARPTHMPAPDAADEREIVGGGDARVPDAAVAVAPPETAKVAVGDRVVLQRSGAPCNSLRLAGPAHVPWHPMMLARTQLAQARPWRRV